MGVQLGQFQVSDLMFPREVRLPFQDYMAYRLAGITYDRGVLFDRSVGPVNVGLFGPSGKMRSVTGPAGLDEGDRDVDKEVWGLDASGSINQGLYWKAQFLFNRWDNFIDNRPNQSYEWSGGFAGVDYVTDGPWVYSLLYNYADANDLANTNTIYEGIDINSMTLTSSYYFMRNIKGIAELNVDLQGEEDKTGTYWTGHLSNEHYFVLAFDAAF